MTKARDISKLLSTANGKIAGENLDVSFENITDTGTEGTRVATGTSAERGATQGQLRFNTDTGLAEYYTGTAFKAIDSPPTVSSIDVTEVDSQAGGNQTIVITGSSFSSGATVTFVGASGTDFNASTVTVDSDTQITAVAPKASFLNAQEPYGVKVENTSGLSATLASQINVDSSPIWNTASGSLGQVARNTSANFSVSATDPDGETVSYSETTSVLSGAGFSLNSSTGAITGTANNVSSDTTDTFTLRATANSKNVDRIFSILTKIPDGSTQALAVGSGADLVALGITTDGTYWLQPSGGSGTAFQAYVVNSKYGGGWVKIAQYYNGQNILNNSSAVNSGSNWTQSLKSLHSGKISNTDIHALQSNGTNDSILLTISDGGASDDLFRDSGGTNRGFGKFEIVGGSLSNFGTTLTVSGTNRWYMDSDANGSFELVGQYAGSGTPCGHATSYWVQSHLGGTFITGSPVNGDPPDQCFTFGDTGLYTNLHPYTGTSNASAGSVQWGTGSSSNSVAIFIK